MIDLYYYEQEPEDFREEDITHMLDILQDRGYTSTRTDIRRAWEAYSDSFCAGWLLLPDEDELVFNALLQHMKS